VDALQSIIGAELALPNQVIASYGAGNTQIKGYIPTEAYPSGIQKSIG